MKSASVSTRVTWQAMLSASSMSWTNSASLGSSSRCRIRNGEFIACLAFFDASRRRLVDHRPEDPELLDGVDELVKVHGLHHVGVHTQPIARHHILFFMGRSEHHHRNQLELLI